MFIQTYGLILSLASVVCIILCFTIHREQNDKAIEASALFLILGFIFSRLFYVLANIPYYFQEISKPLAVFKVTDGGLSLFGCLFGILIAMRVINKKSLFTDNIHFLDTVGVIMWIFISIIRFAERYTDMGLGKDIEISGIFTIADEYGFNVLTIYNMESLFAIVGFIIFSIIFYNHYKHERKYNHPYIFLIFLIVFSSSQIVFESLRNDGHMLIGFIHIQEILYAIMLVVSLYTIHSKLKDSASKRETIFLTFIIFILVLIDFAMEFVIDGRLNLPINIGLSALARNYIIISTVSILFVVIGIKLILRLKKASNE